jgi:hypothetical protein
MNYTTVYEYVLPAGSNILYIIPLILIVGIGIGILITLRLYNKPFTVGRQLIKFFGYGLTSVAGLFLIIMIFNIPKMIASESSLKKDIVSNSFRILEGDIENFKTEYISGQTFDSFEVKDVYFKYSDYIIIKGFHQTSKNGGPIKENGQKVRISYREVEGKNCIVKLEMAALN